MSGEVRARVRVTLLEQDKVAWRLTSTQAALVCECLGLEVGGIRGDVRLAEFYLGGPEEQASDIVDLLRPIAYSGHWDTVSFSMRQLHIIKCSLNSAVESLISDEDFHVRTGWYRENAIALSRELGRSLRELLADPQA